METSKLYLYLLAINALSFIFYGVDKLKARHHHWRIPEWTLLALAIIGGSVGALLAMHLFHHKTRKPAFRFGVPAILLITLILITFSMLSCTRDVVIPVYEGEMPQTGLAVVIINTPDDTKSIKKNTWTSSTNVIVVNPDRTIAWQGTAGIKGRGNSSWTFDKKPYLLRLDQKAPILGMHANKHWCLLANWLDRTLMRNTVAFEIAHRCPGLEWTPSGRFVEVVLNGTHIGNYYLCEQIRVGKHRVNIADLDPLAVDGDGITGGYLMELDTYYDEVNKFRSKIKKYPWMFHDPDEVNEQQKLYMQNYVNELENALYTDSRFAAGDYLSYIDLESFIDWWFVYELTQNGEPGHPKSCFMNKDKNGVLKAGPVWDFDWYTFVPTSSPGYTNASHLYYDRLLQSPEFRRLAKRKWKNQKPAFRQIPEFIDQVAILISTSESINHQMWPITWVVNQDENKSFHDAVDCMKTAYSAKLAWLDEQISSW